MTGSEIFFFIKEKIANRYPNDDKSSTRNNFINTVIFEELFFEYKANVENITLENDEFPILECKLPNRNYFLMTTRKMISIYNDRMFNLSYLKYLWFDEPLFLKNLPLFEGKTKVFKYYSIDNEAFWYEIDALQPADIAHSCILYHMRMSLYKKKCRSFG